MNEDDDLKLMFDAQRELDKALAPAFDSIFPPSSTPRSSSLVGATSKPLSLRLALTTSAIAVSALFAYFVLRLALQTADREDVAAAVDRKELHRVCDSLLAAIRESESDAAPLWPQDIREEMDWPTGTDSLLPIETLAFEIRTTP